MTSGVRQTDAVILCGGLGTRLRGEIGESQKTMAGFDGRPFLERLIHVLHGQGIRRMVLCAGYRAGQVEEYFRTGQPDGCEIIFSVEDTPLGTGGALKQAAGLIQSDPFFALNGDSLCELDYPAFLAFHRKRKALATIALASVEKSGDFGTVETDGAQRIRRFAEKEPGPVSPGAPAFVNAGVYCFQQEVFGRMPEAGHFSLEHDLFPRLTAERLYGYPSGVPFFDIGTPERYRAMQSKFRKAG